MKARPFTFSILTVLIPVVSLGLLLTLAGIAQGRGPGPTAMDAVEQRAENIEFVSQIGGEINAVAAQGSYAYLGIGPRLVVLDVSDPAQPTVVGQTVALPGFRAGHLCRRRLCLRDHWKCRLASH